MGKKVLKTYLLCLLLTAGSLICAAQGKIYTRKVLLSDFTSTTLKVVADPTSLISSVMQTELASCWRISPYEFCTPKDYDKLQGDNGYYFLNLVEDEGVCFIRLSKGGWENDPNTLKRPFEVIRVPVASATDPNGRELLFMDAFLDIIQDFVEQAMQSDRVAYAGLETCNGKRLTGKRVYVNSELVEEHYSEGTPDALVGISIVPSTLGLKSRCYKMLIDAQTHELFYYSDKKYKDSSEEEFSKAEIKSFDRRNGIIPR